MIVGDYKLKRYNQQLNIEISGNESGYNCIKIIYQRVLSLQAEVMKRIIELVGVDICSGLNNELDS